MQSSDYIPADAVRCVQLIGPNGPDPGCNSPMLAPGEEKEAFLVSRWFFAVVLAQEGSGHSAQCRLISESLQLLPASSKRRKLA